MKTDDERRLDRYERAVEFIGDYGLDFNPNKARLLIDLAHVEAIRINADSQRLLAETMVEANRLKRIELGLENPQTGGVADRFTAIPDLSGQRPPDAPTG